MKDVPGKVAMDGAHLCPDEAPRLSMMMMMHTQTRGEEVPGSRMFALDSAVYHRAGSVTGGRS
ncbi:hypothetical protein EYF80_026217 [Liparis tanakae]|uniref:Uncharacterized protein n=1 Tax=Liparis tanakae TaxID=230148 RepID=A0A4Z2HE60_9TELE|nr:hypothetical protein EYF80_026217 [Liparis tanakae]